MVLSSIGLIGLFLLQSDLATLVFRAMWITAACTYVYTIALAVQLDGPTGWRSAREAVFFPGLLERDLPQLLGLPTNDTGDVVWTIFVYAWISVSMLGAWAAKVVESTRVGRVVTPMLVYLVGYGPVLCAVTVDSYIKEFRHAEAKWDKTEKTGRVH